jgi:hypothetical protein
VSNVVDFLQRAGEDSQLRYASCGGLEQALAQTNIAPALREALLKGDSTRLATLLGSQLDMCGYVFAPEDEDEQEPEEQDSGEEKQQDTV